MKIQEVLNLLTGGRALDLGKEMARITITTELLTAYSTWFKECNMQIKDGKYVGNLFDTEVPVENRLYYFTIANVNIFDISNVGKQLVISEKLPKEKLGADGKPLPRNPYAIYTIA